MQQKERAYYGDTSTVLYASDGSSYVPSTVPEYVAQFESAVAYPYIDRSATLDSHIFNAFWKNTTGSWTTFNGNSGKALAIETAADDSAFLTFYYDIDPGYKMSLQSFSFYQRSSSTGYAQWSLLVNNTKVGSGNIFVDAVNQDNPMQWTGDQALTTAMNALTGTVRIDIILKGGTHGSQGTFRMDNFTLNGYTVPTS